MLLKRPNPLLYKRSKSIYFSPEQLLALAAVMKIQMIKHKGMGLAAVQIGYLYRAFVMQNIDSGDVDLFVNPQIIKCSGDVVTHAEGCLSIPNIVFDKKRHTAVDLQWHDPYNKKHLKTFYGVEAFCVQHEMDHLDGKMLL